MSLSSSLPSKCVSLDRSPYFIIEGCSDILIAMLSYLF
jgi:hypothetical protein